MERRLPQPDQNRLSVITALVLLAYILPRVVVLPTVGLDLNLLGLAVRLELNTLVVMLALAGGLAAAGADWLVRAHPYQPSDRSTRSHWIVPSLATLGAGAVLARIPEGLAWWLGLALSAALLLAVLVTEYVVHDDNDLRYDGAAIGLTALCYLLVAGAFFTIRAVGLRAALAIPLVFLVSAAVAWRLLLLQQPRSPAVVYSLLIGLMVAEVAWGLHYWRLTPIRNALILGLAVYILTGLARSHIRGGIDRAARLEFGAVATLGLLAIALLS